MRRVKATPFHVHSPGGLYLLIFHHWSLLQSWHESSCVCNLSAYCGHNCHVPLCILSREVHIYTSLQELICTYMTMPNLFHIKFGIFHSWSISVYANYRVWYYPITFIMYVTVCFLAEVLDQSWHLLFSWKFVCFLC